MDLVAKFAADAERHVGSVSAALEGGNATTLRDAAHALKGSSRAVGAARVASVCEHLEKIGKTGTVADADSFLVALRQELGEALLALKDASSDSAS